MEACRYCKEELGGNKIPTRTYWHGRKNIKPYSHPECKAGGEAKEAYECQVIDADCNDCKHFSDRKRISKTAFKGQCLKLNTEVNAYPNFASGHECFEHRKDGKWD